MTLAELPGTTPVYVVGWGEATLADVRKSEPDYVTTEEAEQRWSYKRETWAGWAKAGLIKGAEFDRMWRLPPASCREHVRRLLESRRRRARTSTQTAGAGSASFPAR